VNDVYAGDDDLHADVGHSKSQRAFAFRVLADANPDVLLRVASQLLLSNVAPYTLTLQRISHDSVQIDAELRGVTEITAESIRRKLLQLSCAETVEVSEVADERPFKYPGQSRA
jgi:hypothetical protein